MNPHQKNKVDISSLSPDEQRLLRLYGKVPTKKDLLQNKLKERKYFDSGDYALSKAGKASDVGVTSIGSRHPVPENIPHLTATAPGAQNPAAATPGVVIGATTNNHNHNHIHNHSGVGGISNASHLVSTPGPIPGSISGHPGSIGFQSRSSIKENSFVQRKSSLGRDYGHEESADSVGKNNDGGEGEGNGGISPPPARQGVPIRQ